MHKIWTNFLRLFAVVQFRNIEHSIYSEARLNPWNPLSCIIMLVIFLAYLLAYGYKGVGEKVKIDNPFKWQR